MKSLITVLLVLLTTNLCFSQYSWEVKIENFKQINETTIEWEIWMKKGGESLDFAYYGGQFTFQFDNNLMNGGKFVTEYFTIVGGEEMNQHSGFYKDEDAVIAGTPPNMFFNWLSSAPPNTGQSQTIISDTWIKFATFQAQLRKGDGNGNPHNFSDVDPKFAFHVTQSQIVSRDNVTQSTYSGVNVNIPTETSSGFTPARGVSANDRQLAGYWFTGEGNWSETARWNNITNENKNVVPPLSTNNVGIAGQATVTDARTVNQLAVALDGLLVLSGDAGNTGHLTVNGDLFNDNQTPAPPKDGEVVIAGWDFQTATPGQTQYPYKADYGVAPNINNSPLTTTATPMSSFDFASTGGTIAPRAQNWYFFDEDEEIYYYYSWVVQFSTSGYQVLKLSSKQRSITTGPLSFKLQWSLNGTNWTDVSDGTVTVDQAWITGVISSLQLPTDLDNQSTVYVRWLNTSLNGIGSSAIDDIIITGEEIPPPPTGILIASTADGTGSLIHNTADVEATIERYIPAAGYHLVSAPFTQASNPLSGWFIWSYLYEYDVVSQLWESMGNATWTPLNVNQGYMVYKYPGPDKWSSDTTYAMTGLMNSGSFVCAVSGDAQDHNLVPNPYPSAIDWDAAAGWTKSDIYNAIWIWNNGNYAAYVNGTPANGGSKYIPVGQAFFIQASGASAGLTMNNNVRVHNDQPFFKDAEEQLNVLRIKAKSNNYRDEMVVYFDGEASTAFDGQFDASKMFGLPEAPQIYSVSTDNRNLTINGMPFSNEVISIPVGFSLNTAGEVTFEASSIESFDPEVTIFLWDMLTNTMTNLRENQQYNFVHNPDNDPVRFALLFNSAVGIAESATNPVRLYAADNKLYLHIPEEIDEDFLVQLFDTGGRMIFSTTASTGSTIINVPSLGAGIYVVQLVSDRHSVVKKVFMK